MSRAVILGGAGFIGRWLARALLERGWEVAILDRNEPAAGHGLWLPGDAYDPQALADAVRPGDTVVHLIHSSIPVESASDPGSEFHKNVIPYAELLQRLAGLGPRLVVYSSSGGQVYGEAGAVPIPESAALAPVSGYGLAKAAMEHLTRLATRGLKLPHLIVRLSNPYGPFQELTNRHGVIPALFRSVLEGRPVTVYGKGATVRDYIYIEDAAVAVAELIERRAENTAVNVGTGLGTSLEDLIRMAEAASGGQVARQDAPLRPSDVMVNVLDPRRLRELTGFIPGVRLDEGLRRTWEHLKAHAKK